MTPRIAFALSLILASAAATAASSSILPPTLALDTVVSGLDAPLAVRHAPGDPRLFIVERGGRILIVDATDTLLPTPFLNLGSGGTAPPLGFTTGDERGLLGLAFHPDYTSNGQFYVYYTDGNGDTVVARYLRSGGDANLADAGSGSVVLRVDQDFSNHNGGDIQFGPDDYLYVGLGDGGSFDDPCNRAQTLSIGAILTGTQNSQNCSADSSFTSSGGDFDSLALLGKMLRIDVDASVAAAPGDERCGFGDAGTVPYGIPADNPYRNADGICDEVWHAGLRNPFRFSFDRATDDLLIGDVGQGEREEIDAVPGDVGGLNFGWRCREGDIAGNRTSLCGSPPPFIDPVLVYDHAESRCSITGGYRHRGPQRALEGVYFYADYCSGEIFAARPFDGVWQSTRWLDTSQSPASFGEDADGTVYLVDLAFGAADQGRVSRIVTAAIFRDGAEPEN
jgi:glucose/arabinose dehydrogenase